MSAPTILEVNDLRVEFERDGRTTYAVNGVSLSLRAGEVVALVGESGSGKTVSAMTVLGLTRRAGARCSGEVWFQERNLLTLTERELRSIRGVGLSMIFQNPMTSLNPLMRVGDQVVEMLRLHTDLSRSAANAKAISLLDEVGVADAATRMRAFPHELSGGMRQRVMIAMALSCDPAGIIADEPTTALDVTIQAQILELLRGLAVRRGAGVLLITHDLGVVADVADTVAVMYAGRIVEYGSCEAVFMRPQHPYTWGLLASSPRVDRPRVGRLRPIEGQPPVLVEDPQGCGFRDRCVHAFEQCRETPSLQPRREPGHLDACWLPVEGRASQRERFLEADRS